MDDLELSTGLERWMGQSVSERMEMFVFGPFEGKSNASLAPVLRKGNSDERGFSLRT